MYRYQICSIFSGSSDKSYRLIYLHKWSMNSSAKKGRWIKDFPRNRRALKNRLAAELTSRPVWHWILIQMEFTSRGCRDGKTVRALASHQCGLGSIPRSSVKCGLSLLVLFPAPRGFLWVLRFPLSSKDHHLTWFLLIVNLSLQCPQLALQR